MALPVTPAADPTAPPPDMSAGGGSSVIGAASPDVGDSAPMDQGERVVCTIVSMGDGTYKLYHGDEPEEGADTGEAPPPAPEGDEDLGGGNGEATAGPISGSMEGEGGDGQIFDAIGPLLKAVLDCIKEDHEASGGMSDQASFDGGFDEDSSGGAAPGGRKAVA